MTGPDVPTNLDLDALQEIQIASGNRVKTIRTRAEKWIPAIASISGLVAAVLVVKGPDAVTKLDAGWRVFIGLSFVAALICFGVATYLVYSAAFGKTDSTDFDPKTVVGLHARLLKRRIEDEGKVKEALTNGVVLVFLGVAFLAIGVGLSWFAPPASSADGGVCITGPNGALAQIPDGSSITRLEGGLSVGKCP